MLILGLSTVPSLMCKTSVEPPLPRLFLSPHNALAVGHIQWGSEKNKVMIRRHKSNKKIRYAVVGLGHIAQVAVLPGFKHAGNSELVTIVSGDGEKQPKQKSPLLTSNRSQ